MLLLEYLPLLILVVDYFYHYMLPPSAPIAGIVHNHYIHDHTLDRQLDYMFLLNDARNHTLDRQ